MKILNLYAGLGGNRQLWGNKHEIISIEINPVLAECYQGLYPNDKVIIGDAIEYLKKYFQDFDFICASPPCYTHTRFTGQNHKPKFPDLTLYSIILFLGKYYSGKYCIENVVPWYPPLIHKTVKLGRHLFWSNFRIPDKKFTPFKADLKLNPKKLAELRGIPFNIYQKIKGPWRNHDMKGQVLRNMVNPEIGKYILDCAIGDVNE